MYISKYCRFVGTGPILYVNNFETQLFNLEEDGGAPPFRIYILIFGFKYVLKNIPAPNTLSLRPQYHFLTDGWIDQMIYESTDGSTDVLIDGSID